MNVASATELIKLLLSSKACCPFCGADLVVNDGKCDACGALLDPNIILRYITLKLPSIKLESYETSYIMNLFAESTYRSSQALEYLRSKISSILREQKREGDITKVLYEREKEVLESLVRILNLQQEALNLGTLDAIERAHNELANVLKLYGSEIPPEVLGLYMLPDFALIVADNYYRSNHHKEAIRWYGYAAIATVYPESSPKGLPKRFSTLYIPYGVAHIDVFDGDFDGKPEIFYVPSSDAGAPESPCIVVNEGGVSWEPISGYEATFPVYGDIGEFQVVIFAWESRRFSDAKLISMGEEVKIIRNGETRYSVPTHMILHADIDRDNDSELVIATGNGRVCVLDSKDRSFIANTIQTGDVSSMALLRLKDDMKIVAATVDGRLLLIDPAANKFSLIDSGFKEPCSILVTSGDFDADGFDEIYLSTRDGGYRYIMRNGEWSGSRIVEGNIFGMRILDINNDGKNELLVMKKDGELLLEIYVLREALGVQMIEKVASYPITTPAIVDRACVNYNIPFSSKPVFICEDIDLDQAPELLVGLNRSLLIVDPKYA